MTLAVIILWILSSLNLLAIILLFRQFGLLYLGSRQSVEIPGVDVGERLVDIDSVELRWSDVGPGRVNVVVLTDNDCPIGREITRDIARLVNAWGDDARFIIGVRPVVNRDAPLPPVPDRVMLVPSSVIHERLDIEISPYLYLVSFDGLVLERRLVGAIRDISRSLAYQFEDRLSGSSRSFAVSSA